MDNGHMQYRSLDQNSRQSICRANRMRRMLAIRDKRRMSDNTSHPSHHRISGTSSDVNNNHELNGLNNKRSSPFSQHVACGIY